MQVKFWGTRGSIPSPIQNNYLQSKIKNILDEYKKSGSPSDTQSFIDSLPFNMTNTFGGNTSCLEIENGLQKNEHLIMDAGSGLRLLGNHPKFKEPGQIFHIFISHFHWDHINGIPFFIPGYNPENEIHYYGCSKDLEKTLRSQQKPLNFPVPFDMGAKKFFHRIAEGDPSYVGDFIIDAFAQNHPGGSNGFRIQNNNKKLIYSTDSEYDLSNKKSLDKFKITFDGADLLVFDAQYDFSENIVDKKNWGHSNYATGLDIVKKCNIKKVCFFHNDPSSTDEELVLRHQKAIKYSNMNNNNKDLEIIWAYDSLIINI